MNTLYISHEEATAQSFRDDPEFAAEYLNTVLEEGGEEELLLAFNRVSLAFGMSEIAAFAHLNAKSLYRALSPQSNSELKIFQSILNKMGMRLAITPISSLQLGVNN